MTIVRYNTLNALPARNLQEEFKQVFERFFGDVAGDQAGQAEPSEGCAGAAAPWPSSRLMTSASSASENGLVR